MEVSMLKKMLNAMGIGVDSHEIRSDGAVRYYLWRLTDADDHWSARSVGGEVYVAPNGPGTRLCMLSFNAGGHDHDVTLTAALPYVGYVAVSLERLPEELTYALGQTGKWGDQREVSLRFFDIAAWWTIWMNPYSSSSRDPRWRRGSFHPLDALFGAQRLSREDRDEPKRVRVPMPEGSYDAKVTMSTRYYTRERWPFEGGPKFMYARQRSHDTEIKGGIPEPGKGENAWDCDDDAMFSMSGPADSVEDAIGRVVASVLRTRMKRQGHYGWDRPAEKAAE